MKKIAAITSLLILLCLGSAATAQAGSHFSFGFSIRVGPAIPYGFYYYQAYTPYYYPGYYAHPEPYSYYRTYTVPRYYGRYRIYEPRYYYRKEGRGERREGRFQPSDRSRSNPRRY
jgi:hypothetical protein